MEDDLIALSVCLGLFVLIISVSYTFFWFNKYYGHESLKQYFEGLWEVLKGSFIYSGFGILFTLYLIGSIIRHL